MIKTVTAKLSLKFCSRRIQTLTAGILGIVLWGGPFYSKKEG